MTFGLLGLYRLLIVFLLVSLPFFFGQLDVRIYYVIYATAILLLPFSIKTFFRRVYKEEKHRLLFLAFFLLLVSSFVSALFSVNQVMSFAHFFLFLSFFIVFIVSYEIFSTESSRFMFSYSLVYTAFTLSIISFFNTVIANRYLEVSEPASFMMLYLGHNHLSAILLFALPISFYLYKKNAKDILSGFFHLSIFLFLSFSIFLTFGRASLLSLFVVLLFVYWKLRKRFRKQHVLYAAVLFLIVTAVVFAITPISKSLGYKKKQLSYTNSRFVYWKEALRIFQEKPLTGSGLDTYGQTAKIEGRKVFKTQHVHNFFLQMLSDAGILGFFSSLFLMFLLLSKVLLATFTQNGVRSMFGLALFLGIAASAINSLVDFDWQLPFVFLLFWIEAGMLLRVGDQSKTHVD